MKLAVTLTQEPSIEALIEAGAEIFILGLDEFSHRMNHTFNLEDLKRIIKILKQHHKEVYINLNRIVHDTHLSLLEGAIEQIKDFNVEGILYTDLAVFMFAEKHGLTSRLIYAPETYTTHSYDLEFWNNEQIQAVVLAREVTLEDLESIAHKKLLPIVFFGHGYINMFHSRRPLIENFFKHTKDKDPEEVLDRRDLTIVEEIRDEHYPIYQDTYGTHIFREKPRQSFTVLERLKEVLDVFVVDSILLKESDFIEAVADYRLAIDKEVSQSMISKYKHTHDDGLYFKRTQAIKGEKT